MDRIKDIIFYGLVLLLPFLLVAVIMHWINIITFFPFIILSLFCLNRDEAFFSVLIILTPLFGSITQFFFPSLPLGAIFSLVVSFSIMNVHIVKMLSKRNQLPIVYTLAVIVVIFLFYILGPINELSTNKIIDIVVSAVPLVLGIMLFCMSKSIRVDRISLMFLLFGISLICVAYDLKFYPRLDGVFDFSTIRSATSEYKRAGLPYMSYHLLGFSGVWAISYLFSARRGIGSVYDIIILIVSVWLVLLSGARQTVLATIVITAVWLMLRSGRIQIRGFLYLSVALLVGFLVLSLLDLEVFRTFLDTEEDMGSRLNRDLDTPLEVMGLRPIFGIGLGQYPTVSKSLYPHNLIIEIISELGIVGFLMLLAIVVSYIRLNRFSLTAKLKNGTMSLIVFVPYFMRSMISEDLGANIVVFISFFFLYNYNYRKKESDSSITQNANNNITELINSN